MYAPDVPLPDQDTSMVNALGQAALEHLGLQPSLQEILDLQGQHVIETHARLVEHTNSDETTDKGVTLEQTLGILVIELEEFTSSTTDLGEDEGNSPDLALVAQTVFTSELSYYWHSVSMDVRDSARWTHLQLGIETSRLERSTRDLVSIHVLTSKTIGGKGS